MTTHPLGRLCGSVFAALLAAAAIAGCSETQPPITSTGIAGDDGTGVEGVPSRFVTSIFLQPCLPPIS